MVSITKYLRNAHQDYNEVLHHTSQNGQHQKIYKCWRGCGEKRIHLPFLMYVFNTINSLQTLILVFPCGSVVKNLPPNEGDAGSIPESERSLGEENGNPLGYPCLGNSMDRGPWWATVHRVTKEFDMTKQLNNSHADLATSHQFWYVVFPFLYQFSSVAQLCPTLSPHEPQHTRPPCPSPSPRVYSNSCPLSR